MPSVPSAFLTLSAIGGTGVHVFFLCSGIGLYGSYLKQSITFPKLIKKRFVRIYLPYIAVVVLSFFLPWLYDKTDRVAALLSHVFLFKMFVPAYEMSFGTHFWFLSTLFQLYALFLPLCFLKRKLGGKPFFLCCFGISVLWWVFCFVFELGEIRIWGSFCLQYLWEFAAGFLLAERFYQKNPIRLHPVLLGVFAVCGIGLQASMALFSEYLKIFNDIPALLGYASLALLLLRIPLIQKACRAVSVFSYEFYLLHILVIATVFYAASPNGLLQEAGIGILALLATLGAARGYHRLIAACSRKNRY